LVAARDCSECTLHPRKRPERLRLPSATMLFISAVASSSAFAQQGARANDHVCHDPCCCTVRASRGRGSSLTFGETARCVGRFLDAKVQSAAWVILMQGRSRERRTQHRTSKKGACIAGGIRGEPEVGGSRQSGERVRSRVPRRRIVSSPASVVLKHEGRRFVFQFRFTALRSIRIPGAPNKSPEPTPTSVTPRATAPFSEMKPPTETRWPARVVPAVVVAHL
jgi:hypothetical protein